MKITVKDNNIVLSDVKNFELEETLDCGQAFRWQKLSDTVWHGVALGRYIKIEKQGSAVTLYDMSLDEFKGKWLHYFDFERDYGKIIEILSADETLKKASAFGGGIRILNQEPWETLCSFIISQNNNIPRIKGIVERLCENFGERLAGSFYTFPTAEKIASLSLEDLSVLRSGFRAKYILDAAKKVADGTIDLEALKNLDTDTARGILTTIYGVGDKVADCTLLFGLGHINALPKDVWIKRAIAALFDGTFPECALNYAGIAQQYLFHFARTTKLDI